MELNRKELCERYPFLVPRNVWTDNIAEDYDYSYIRGEHELPNGWMKLFLQMCEEIRQPLIEANYLEKFRFSQIKEKYGTMRCYHFGAPEEANEIILKYEYFSQFVCMRCGKPANLQTLGWIESVCSHCNQDSMNVTKIKFDPVMKIIKFGKSEPHEKEYDVSYIGQTLWRE